MFILGVVATKVQPNIRFVGGYTLGYIGTTNNININITSLTGGIDTRARVGDIVIVINGICSAGTVPAVLPDGYTEIFSGYSADSYYAGGNISYKILTALEDYVTLVGGTTHADRAGSTSILVFRGIDDVTPLDVTSLYTNSANTVKSNPPSITPITNGSVIVCGGVGGHVDGTGVFTSSDLTNFISSTGNDVDDCTTGIGYKEWVSGAFDAAQFGFTGTDSTDYSSIGYTIALRPK